MSIVVGIDPGLTGALALFTGGALTEVIDMPTFGTRIDGMELHRILARWEPDVVCLEDVHAMPKNGSVATFKLGEATGIVTGVVHTEGIPLRRVSPQVWKKQAGLLGKPKGTARGLASELYPHFADRFRRVKDDGRADAVLIARFGVYDQIHNQMRETHDQGADADRPAGDGPVHPDEGRDRHPAARSRGDQRGDPGEGGGSEGVAEVRPFVRPAGSRRRAGDGRQQR